MNSKTTADILPAGGGRVSRAAFGLWSVRSQAGLAVLGLCCLAAGCALWFSRDLCWFRATGAAVLLDGLNSHLRAFAAGNYSFQTISDYSPLLFFCVALFLKVGFGGLCVKGLIVFNVAALVLSGLALAYLAGGRSFGLALLFYFSLLVHYPFICSFTMETVFPFVLFLFLLLCARIRDKHTYGSAAAAALLLAFALLVKETFILYCLGPFLFLAATCTRKFWTGLLLFILLSLTVFVVLPEIILLPSTVERLEGSRYVAEILNEGSIRNFGEILYVPRDNLRSLFFEFINFSPASLIVHALFFLGLFRPKSTASALAYSSYLGFVAFLVFYPSGRDKISFYYPMYGLVCMGAAQWLTTMARKKAPLLLSVAAVPCLSLCMLFLLPAQMIVTRLHTFNGVNVDKLKRIVLQGGPGPVDVHLFDFREEMRILRVFALFDRAALNGRYRFISIWPPRNLSGIEIRGRFRKYWKSRRKTRAVRSLAVLHYVPAGLERCLVGSCHVFPTGESIYVLRRPSGPGEGA